MKSTLALLTVLAWMVATSTAADESKTVWTFDDQTPGEAAEGFHEEVGEWKVADDDGNKVLFQKAKNPDATFNVVLVEGLAAKDLDLSVRLKAVGGNDDQGGGLVWRAIDKDNYFICRFNPLEDNFRVYTVVKGKRTMLKNANIKHIAGWHTVRVTMRGNQIECFFDGKKYLEATDATFPKAGRIGLWSKADAQSYFDDLSVEGATVSRKAAPQKAAPRGAAPQGATREFAIKNDRPYLGGHETNRDHIFADCQRYLEAPNAVMLFHAAFIQGITNFSGTAPHPEMGGYGTGPNDRGVRFYYEWVRDHVGRWEYPKHVPAVASTAP